jgi:hypothetical protein
MIIDILNEIASTSSRLEKEAILKREKDNETLKRVFFLAYDPFTQFYIRKIPAYTTEEKPWHSLDSALPKLDKLSTREITGNAAIQYLSLLLSEVTAKDAEVIERIIGKDLKCGASESTANKIWPDLIHEYPCMLASGYDQKLVDKMKFPAIAQLKMDGMRFNAVVIGDECNFYSRNGKTIDLRGNLVEEFVTLANGKNIVFDGELVVESGDKYLDRQTGNGILNKAVKGTISAAEAQQVCATLWDVIPYEDFTKGHCDWRYVTRFDVLKKLPLSGKVRLVEHKVVGTIDEARETFESYLAQGQEGIILKDLNGVWEDKRAKHQVKFKGELECELRVVDVQPGTGKYQGMLGALICESEDGVLKVDVGSGFKDDQRVDSNSYVGKIVSVKYNARIKNKQGEESLFLPVFVEVREDKDVADRSDQIK